MIPPTVLVSMSVYLSLGLFDHVYKFISCAVIHISVFQILDYPSSMLILDLVFSYIICLCIHAQLSHAFQSVLISHTNVFKLLMGYFSLCYVILKYRFGCSVSQLFLDSATLLSSSSGESSSIGDMICLSQLF